MPVRANTWDRVRTYIGQYGLIAVLLIMPVVFGIHDLASDGSLTRLGNNFVAGISNGASASGAACALTFSICWTGLSEARKKALNTSS